MGNIINIIDDNVNGPKLFFYQTYKFVFVLLIQCILQPG